MMKCGDSSPELQQKFINLKLKSIYVQISYKASLLHLQPRQMRLIVTELRDDMVLSYNQSKYNTNSCSEDEEEENENDKCEFYIFSGRDFHQFPVVLVYFPSPL